MLEDPKLRAEVVDIAEDRETLRALAQSDTELRVLCPGLVLPRTPALDKLWTRIETFTPRRSIPEPRQFKAPLPRGIEASRECTACDPYGKLRRTRERTAEAPSTTAERMRRYRDRHTGKCRVCRGTKVVSYDARPKLSASGHVAPCTTDEGATHGLTFDASQTVGATAPFEFIADAELRRNRAMRRLTRAAREVGDAWARRFDGRGLRTTDLPLTTVWPLTPSGRAAYAVRTAAADREAAALLERACAAADREAAALVESAELEARAALRAEGFELRAGLVCLDETEES